MKQAHLGSAAISVHIVVLRVCVCVCVYVLYVVPVHMRQRSVGSGVNALHLTIVLGFKSLAELTYLYATD